MERTLDLFVTSSAKAAEFRVYAESETHGQAEGDFTLDSRLESLSHLESGATSAADFETRGAALHSALFAGSIRTLFIWPWERFSQKNKVHCAYGCVSSLQSLQFYRGNWSTIRTAADSSRHGQKH